MKKFAAALLSVVLVAFVTLFGVAAPSHAIGTATCDPAQGVTTSYYSNAPYISSSAYYFYPQAGSAYSGMSALTATGFASPPTYTITPALPSGLTINSGTGVISGTPSQASSATLYKIQATGTPSNTNNNTVTSYCAGIEISIQVNAANGGGGGGTPYTMQNFTFASSSVTPNAPVSNLSAGAAMPGFTSVGTGVSAGGQYDMLNIAVGDLGNGTFYSLAGASSNTNINSYGSWNPSTRNCGITRFAIGGVNQTSSSGVTCEKLSSVYNGVTQYWISIRLSSPTTSNFAVDLADGVFTVVSPSNADFINVFATYPDSSSHIQYSCSISKLLNAVSPGIGSSGSADTSISLPTGIGQPVAGQSVGVTASNLALNTNYSVVLRSTPQILDQGTTTATIMNTTVTIPAGLEPGWHSITFTATRSDGQSIQQIAYFKINASGILLETAETTPAELAYTGHPEAFQWTTGALLALLGVALIAAVLIYRRRVFEMVYVLTGNAGQYDIELVEQPKNARFIPMRKL